MKTSIAGLFSSCLYTACRFCGPLVFYIGKTPKFRVLVSIKIVKTIIARTTCYVFIPVAVPKLTRHIHPKMPFSNHHCLVSAIFEYSGNCTSALFNQRRIVCIKYPLLQITSEIVSACQQTLSGWCTNRTTGMCISKCNTIMSYTVNMRGLKF